MRRRRLGPRMGSRGLAGRVRPAIEGLEERVVLAATTILMSNLDGPATGEKGPGPYGVQQWGVGSQSSYAGDTVADVGSILGNKSPDAFIITAPNRFVDNNRGRAFLVFGSQAATATGSTIVDYLSLGKDQRTGLMPALGTTGQTNPKTGNPGFDYDGFRLISSASLNLDFATHPNLSIGVAPVGDIDNDGYDDFMIGFTNVAQTGSTTVASGRAYLVYGGPQLASISGGIDLENPPSNVRVVKFVSDLPGALTGFSVGGVNNFLRDNGKALVIGAPHASIAGLTQNGAVYVIPAGAVNSLPANNRVIDLSKVGQTNTPGAVAGVVFTGEANYQEAGYSVAPAGDVDGSSGGATGIPDDLLIGAPARPTNVLNPGIGSTYLIYGQDGLQAAQTTTGGTLGISLSRIGATGSSAIPGAQFRGVAGDYTGYSVSTAGDFNGDNVNDILFGAPQYGVFNPGRAYLIQGIAGDSRINGRYALANLPNTIQARVYNGTALFEQLGTAVTAIGRLAGPADANGNRNNDNLDDVAIGGPGIDRVYVVLGTKDAPPDAPVSVASAADLILKDDQDGTNFFGSSLAGRRFPLNAVAPTIDLDAVPDFVIGAPEFQLFRGTGFAIEGKLLYPAQSNSGTTVLPGQGAAAPVETALILPEQPVPTIQELSTLIYKAIPSSAALPAYRPQAAFAARLARFSGLVKTSRKNGTKYYNQPSRGNTLGYGVFSRGRFPVGQVRFQPVKSTGKTFPVNLNK